MFIYFPNIIAKEVVYLDRKDINSKDEYILEINDKQERIIKKYDKEKNKYINLIFENKDGTDIMQGVIKHLTNYYIEDILNDKNF